MVELPSWHSKSGGFSGTALRRRPQNRAKKGTDPRTGTQNGKVKLFPADRGHHVPAPKGGMSGRLCLVCVSLLCLLVALVDWSWSPVAPGCFPWFFSGWMTRALSQGPALSGTPLRTTLLSLSCCFILPIWVSELKVGGDGLRPLAQTNLL